MFNINQLLAKDLSSFPPKEQEYIIAFRENLKEELMEALVQKAADRILNAIKKDKESFFDILSDILINGRKGYKDLSFTTLLNIYLEEYSTEDFIKLIDKVSESK